MRFSGILGLVHFQLGMGRVQCAGVAIGSGMTIGKVTALSIVISAALATGLILYRG